MKRPRYHPPRCRICGSDGKDSGGISATGLCVAHSLQRFEENYYGLKAQRGPHAQWWAARLAASLGYGPLDEMPPKP